jgi:hypothetical protein
MADNVAITAGAGTTIATDDVAGVQFQKVKIDGGGDGASVPLVIDATHGVPVDIKRSVALAVTDNSGSLTVDSAQLPAALVSGRLDVVVGAALPAGSNLVGKATVSQGGNDATVSAGGALKVDNSAVTQPVSYANEATGADKSTFTEGTSRVEVMGAVFNDTISSDPAEDQRSPLRITAKKGLHVNLRNASGTEVGTAGSALRIDPTGGTTQPVLDTNSAAALTALQLLDDTVATTGSAVTAKGILAAGTDGTNARALKTDTSGELQVDVLTLPGVAGTVAHDGADSGNPVKMGGYAISAERAAVANADRVDLVADLTGKQIVLPYANPENFLNGVASSTGTGDTAVIAAQGAGVRIYVTAISVVNTSATNTFVEIKDGTTVMHRLAAPQIANGAPQTVTFPTPLRLTANTALNFAANTGSTTIYVSAVGYRGI